MLTYKENKIEIVRGVLDSLFLESVQRQLLFTVAAYVRSPPDFFKTDTQCPQRYYLGRQVVTESIMCSLTPMMSRMVGQEVVPTYSYPVIYFPGATLKRHKDRLACEVTATLTIVNQPDTVWPIYVEDDSQRTHRVDLNPGDLVVYDGIQFPHWREPQDPGHFNISVFYHFVTVGGPYEEWHQKHMIEDPSVPNLYTPVRLAALFPEKLVPEPV